MLTSVLNQACTTNVFKEEILKDINKKRARDTPHSKHDNMQGTGDLPEAWGNANAVDLLRDMLVSKRTQSAATPNSKSSLHPLTSLSAQWIAEVNDVASAEHTPTTLGTAAFVKLARTSATTLRVEFNAGTHLTDTYIHVPLPKGDQLTGAMIDSHPVPASALTKSSNGGVVSAGELPHRVIFDFAPSSGEAR